MGKAHVNCLALWAMFVVNSAAFANLGLLQYVSPLPGSRLVTCQTAIAIRTAHPFALLPEDSRGLFKVRGTISGQHAVQLVLSDDATTLIAKPEVPFAPGEEVSVDISQDVKEITGAGIGPYSFSFFTRPNLEELHGQIEDDIGVNNFAAAQSTLSRVIPATAAGGQLPSDFPPITITQGQGGPKTEIYISNITFDPIVNSPYLIILSCTGTPRFYRKMPDHCYDFKWQPTGVLTYYDNNIQKVVALDSSFTAVDTFQCGNGYVTDPHECRLLPGGHVILMSYDPEPVRMDTVVEGGDPYAIVLGLVIQELDQQKNVVFQWRSWDHLAITDAEGVNFLAQTIDYVHGNAIELDDDGNLLLSARHMSQIIKINRQTGDVIWRWGGKKNEFRNVGDDSRFSYQHAPRKLPNGHILIFDNGNMRPDQYSRVVEYNLDEQNKVATLVWEYRHSPDIYTFAMAYADRLADGKTVIGWGATNPTVTMIDSSKTVLFEMSFPAGVFSYRAYGFPPLPGSPLTSTAGVAPHQFVLLQNYPNPFNPSTTIGFGIAGLGSRWVNISVYDLLGRKVAELVNGMEEGGYHEVTFDGSGLASGVYIYRITAGDFIQARKLVLLR